MPLFRAGLRQIMNPQVNLSVYPPTTLPESCFFPPRTLLSFLTPCLKLILIRYFVIGAKKTMLLQIFLHYQKVLKIKRLLSL